MSRRWDAQQRQRAPCLRERLQELDSRAGSLRSAQFVCRIFIFLILGSASYPFCDPTKPFHSSDISGDLEMTLVYWPPDRVGIQQVERRRRLMVLWTC